MPSPLGLASPSDLSLLLSIVTADEPLMNTPGPFILLYSRLSRLMFDELSRRTPVPLSFAVVAALPLLPDVMAVGVCTLTSQMSGSTGLVSLYAEVMPTMSKNAVTAFLELSTLTDQPFAPPLGEEIDHGPMM